MSNIFTASIGKKLIMSVSGLFLILFLLLHLFLNVLLVVGQDSYNVAAHFMATNPFIKVMEPILAIGFIVHIIYASVLTLQNQSARPDKYQVLNQGGNASWASRNMYILGGTVFIFLVIHIANFYTKIKFGGEGALQVFTSSTGVEMHDTYSLVVNQFQIWWYVIIYAIGGILLGFHLSHGFWSAFQTIGWSSIVWRKRLETIGLIYAIIVGGGFALIPLYVLLVH